MHRATPMAIHPGYADGLCAWLNEHAFAHGHAHVYAHGYYKCTHMDMHMCPHVATHMAVPASTHMLSVHSRSRCSIHVKLFRYGVGTAQVVWAQHRYGVGMA